MKLFKQILTLKPLTSPPRKMSFFSTFSNYIKFNDKHHRENKHRVAARVNEIKLMELSGLKHGVDLHISDVKINYLGENYIHTVTAGHPDKPNLILLHGYCGSAITYYRMIAQLSKQYNVKCVDLLGTGLSSRPKFELNNTDHVIDFFVDSLEKWRQAQQLETIHLVGHSLGGYLATQYSLKYPDNVAKLSLISPAGVTKHADDEFDFHEWGKKLTWTRNGLSKLFYEFWNKKMTPQSLYRSLSFAGSPVLNNVLIKRLGRPKEESELLFNYYTHMLNLPESSDIAVHYLLRPPNLAAIRPLEEEFARLQIPVDFYYGTRDWMDSTGAQRVSRRNSKQCKFIKIANAGHQIMMDNPEKLAEYLVE